VDGAVWADGDRSRRDSACARQPQRQVASKDATADDAIRHSVLLMLAACVCSAQEEPSPTLKIDVAAGECVRHRYGPARGAGRQAHKENFRLSEDGKDQKIASSTRNPLCRCRSFWR